MKKIILFLYSIILFVSFPAISYAKTIYIMLNIDNTILDRVFPFDDMIVNKIRKQGFNTQILQFIVDKKTSPKFIKIYEKIYKGENLSGKSHYMSNIKVEKLLAEKFRITECLVIRPSLRQLISQLIDLSVDFDVPIKILLTSRNDDARTRNINLNLQYLVNGKSFQDSTTFIPRNWFRVKIKTKNGQEISAKSAKRLREKYNNIHSQDIVILLDHIEDSRFIPGNENDFNILVSLFQFNNSYNTAIDQNNINNIISKIRQRLRSKD